MANRVKERELSLLETNKKLESEIVDRQEAEKARIESERRYQQLVEELPVGVFRSSADYDGRYVMVNPAFIKMLEYKSTDDLTQKSVKQMYRDPHMREMVLEMLFREGTGMGLAVIHGLVNDMGGAIRVESRLGQGAGFHVFLPKLEGGNLDGQESPHCLPKEGSERILFVDDEEGFIRSGKEILEQLGYAVVTAANGLEAYEIFRQNPGSFDLVVSDMAMPKMTGLELAKKVKELNGRIPIILCTGFKEGINEDLKQNVGLYDILLKPVLARELTEAIQKALEMKTT